MEEITIDTTRGVSLSASFFPGDPSNNSKAILFAHGFLGERSCSGLFDQIAQSLNSEGYASLLFDFSGCGTSDDATISLRGQVEDLRSASSWLADLGYTQQALIGHSFGARVAMESRPKHVMTMILLSPITGPLTYRWDEVFSPEQLETLDHQGQLSIPDDGSSSRETLVISQQTLIDYSVMDTDAVMSAQNVPILLVHGGRDDELNGLADLSRKAQPLLPPGSELKIFPEASNDLGEAVDEIAALSSQWVKPYFE
ncbi:MAG: alpha/beta hydrolase [Actinomycetaceae bacterium]|nr:alpha/beta hydrolase [Actinomycetaceae bacterium]